MKFVGCHGGVYFTPISAGCCKQRDRFCAAAVPDSGGQAATTIMDSDLCHTKEGSDGLLLGGFFYVTFV